MYTCKVITYSKGKYQPGKVANPARGQLNSVFFPYPCSRLRTWSRETGSAVPSRVISFFISILRLNLELTYEIPPEFRGGVLNTICRDSEAKISLNVLDTHFEMLILFLYSLLFFLSTCQGRYRWSWDNWVCLRHLTSLMENL